LSLAALAGCSLLRFGYGHLDRFAAWTADEYFDLDPEQKDEFSARFERLHAWHRSEQLPDYAAFLSQARARVLRGLEPEDVAWFVQGLHARYRALVQRGADDAAALLLTVKPAQLEALQRRWERDNRRFVREHRLDAGPEEQRRAQAKRILSRIREWTGALDPEQEARIAAMAEALPLVQRLRHEDRLRRQREFLALMEQRADPERFRARLRHWLLHWEEGRAPEYARAFDEWWRGQSALYVEAARLLTRAQRETLARRLQNHAEDFARLAQRAPQAQAAASR
jgi:hypothetical protein